jgi:hypothetical protein
MLRMLLWCVLCVDERAEVLMFCRVDHRVEFLITVLMCSCVDDYWWSCWWPCWWTCWWPCWRVVCRCVDVLMWTVVSWWLCWWLCACVVLALLMCYVLMDVLMTMLRTAYCSTRSSSFHHVGCCLLRWLVVVGCSSDVAQFATINSSWKWFWDCQHWRWKSNLVNSVLSAVLWQWQLFSCLLSVIMFSHSTRCKRSFGCAVSQI